MTRIRKRLLLTGTLLLLGGLGCTKPAVRQETFTIVMLPDTQWYSEQRPDLFFAQTRWIAQNRDKENIAFVTHVGDLVQNHDKPSEWKVADEAMAVLDGIVPYGVAPGNHDCDGEQEGARKGVATAFLKCFGPQRCQGQEWYAGASPNGLNSCQLFSGGGIDFIILHLEINAPDETLTWAREALERHPTRAAIVSMHTYLRGKDGLGREKNREYREDGNAGEQIWQKFIRRHPQVFMVLCGHMGGVQEFHQVSTNDAGGSVLEMLADYQERENAGNGWLRLIRIDPANKEIRVRTYSPVLDRFETDANSEFTAPLDLPATVKH